MHGPSARLWLLVVLVLLPAGVAAQRLPIRTYTTVDGLASDRVARIVRDPRGFLWFCTTRGVSRFDGERFTTYGPETGLPHPAINDLLITRDGRYWLATNGGGIIAFDVSSRGAIANESAGASDRSSVDAWRFRAHAIGAEAATNRVNVLIEDRQQRIWAGSDAGLFMIERTGDTMRVVPIPLGFAAPDTTVQVWAFTAGDDGSLWVGTTAGLVRRLPDGRMARYTSSTSPTRVLALVHDGEGRIWVGHDHGLLAIMPEPVATFEDNTLAVVDRQLVARPITDTSIVAPREPGHVMAYTTRSHGIPAPVTALTLSSDGQVWLAGFDRLMEFDGREFRASQIALGGIGGGPSPLVEDADGHIWAGTTVDGVVRFAPHGLLTFTEAEGVRGAFVNTFETRDGERCAFTADSIVSCYDGRRFVPVGTPGSWRRGLLTGMRLLFQDRARQWWIATPRGLHRFPSGVRLEDLPRARPARTYDSRSGLPSTNIAKLYEDRRGDLWIATLDASRHVLARWERVTDRIVTYSDADGLLPFRRPLSFTEDRSGALWVGFREGGVVRSRDGRFEPVEERDGAPHGDWVSVHVDRSGRLWIATVGGGVSRIDDPGRARLESVRYTTAAGLSTDHVLCLAEDADGRLYFGTDRGVNRLDPTTGQIRRFTRADGLVASEVSWEAFADRNGAVWFRNGGGLSRLPRVADRPRHAPQVWIDGVSIGDARVRLSALGERSVALGTVSGVGPVQIDFAGSSFGAGGRLRYQYALEGADGDWSAATEERGVRFARLASGNYRLLVRALNSDGAPSAEQASVAFRVLPPIWLRWWALTLGAVAVALMAYGAHRYRVGQLLALERIRGRIATNLHDEVGANLSQIAVLSEVARRRVEAVDIRLVEPLARIAEVSRQSVDAMSTIVWAVDPQRDTIVDLEHRMRRFANDVLTAQDIRVAFPPSGSADRMSLDANVRHEMLLVFKEAINNIVRHADATEVQIDLSVRRHAIVLTVQDDGKGFDDGVASHGLGLRSMRERATRLHGHVAVTSNNGAGTRLTLTVPLRRLSATQWLPRAGA